MNTYAAVCSFQIEGLSTENQDRVYGELMELILEHGGVVDRLHGGVFAAYWSSTSDRNEVLRQSGGAMHLLSDRMAKLNRRLGLVERSRVIRVKAALSGFEYSRELPSLPSAAGRALLAHRFRWVGELCAQNQFLGTEFLMDQETAREMAPWFAIELAGKCRLKNSTTMAQLYKLKKGAIDSSFALVSRRVHSGEIVVTSLGEDIKSQMESFDIRAE